MGARRGGQEGALAPPPLWKFKNMPPPLKDNLTRKNFLKNILKIKRRN